MLPATYALRVMVAGVLAIVASTPALQAGGPQDKFYQAYYLEKAGGDLAAAAGLYEEVVAARGASAELQAQAKARLAACREDLACTDFARLMPPDPLAYVEMSHPGERIRKLIDKLGLLADGSGSPETAKCRVAVSPAVIDALLGMRGIAAAVTGFDPVKQIPSGVVVFHPGDMDLVRGLIETALPVAAKPVGSIGGYPTYLVEDLVYVTLTSRMVIASTQEAEIEGVIYRLRDPGEDSLATNEELADIRRDRKDALLFFFVNPKPLMPLLNPLMAAVASQSREMVIAQALLDIPSFRALSGSFDLSDAGVQLELTLRLDEGHRNLVYNFLRGPAIDPATLACIPPDAAAFLALAFNEAPENYRDGSGSRDPIVTFMDIGREIFANVNGIAVCVLPPASGVQRGSTQVPDVAAAITVNDPAKSQALWSQVLGIASLASGAATMQGSAIEIEGLPARSYRFDKNVTIYVAVSGHHLLIGTTEAALGRTIEAMRGEKSIVDDPVFAQAIERLGPHTTLAVCAHPGRCAEIAKSLAPRGTMEELEPVVELLTDTVASLAVTHSDQMLRFSAVVTGVPDVGDFVSELILRERRQSEVARAVRRGNWDEAVTVYDEMLRDKPGDAGVLRERFDLLAIRKADPDAANAVADELFEHMRDDPDALNGFAWALLTDGEYGQRHNDLALRCAKRCNELTENKVANYVDTLAEAYRLTDDLEQAIRTQRAALALLPPNDLDRRSDFGGRYLKALHQAGRDGEVETFLAELLGALDEHRGAKSPQRLRLVNALGAELVGAGLYTPAVPLYRQATEISRRASGSESTDFASALNMQGVAESWSGDATAAAESFRAALAVHEKLDNLDGSDAVVIRRNLAGTLIELGQAEEGERLSRDVLAHNREFYGDKSLRTAGTLRVLGLALVEKDQAKEAEAVLRECVRAFHDLDQARGERWRVARAECALGHCLTVQRRFDEAERLLLTGYEALRAARGDEFVETQTAAKRVAALYDAWGKTHEAAAWRAKLPLR